MPIRDLLTRKGKSKAHRSTSPEAEPSLAGFTFMRTATNSQEFIQPPSPPGAASLAETKNINTTKRSSRFLSSSRASRASTDPSAENRLSSLLKLRNHSRSRSTNVPSNLPSISDTELGFDDQEAQWEARATILAKGNPNLKHTVPFNEEPVEAVTTVRHVPVRSISNAQGDV